ncbi:MAG: UDP-N-acetylmuramyl tripeptide synthase [Candidatus Saccharibacteria bacterium]|nr:UDP-N-acetylmuramyl tripeptide synthase [Candidatus Saccharibacteria bacterium]
MTKPYSVLMGKAVRYVARLRGGGSALPGLFVETIDKSFVPDVLSQLPQGVVLISGTNGKTTTTKMVVELLESQGMKVFTNRTGSNFIRGVAAALLGEVDTRGKLDADIAVLELDEAHAVRFVAQIKPKYSLLLNVMRDQLDRFGEIDHTANLLHKIALSTTDGVVVNRDDPRLGSEKFRRDITAPLRSYGVSTELLKQFPSDDEMRSDKKVARFAPTLFADDTSLKSTDENHATISYDSKNHNVDLKINGIYNILNAVGAVALCRMIRGDELDEKAMITALQNVTPAFGRGENLTVNGQPCQLVLVKNPSGFRLGLQSFSPNGYATMIAINDNYADGRDMSWLWDVDFDSLRAGGVSEISGIRAYDMALRMQYDDVPVGNVATDLSKSLRRFLSAHSDSPKRIYCTYTAMLALRRELAKVTDVEDVS